MRKLILTLFIALTTFVGVVQAENGQIQHHTILSCFYECKLPLGTFAQPLFWKEVTSIVLVNQNNKYVLADLLFFDGNENPIARAETVLSHFDVDEINVCETLNIYFSPKKMKVPPAGMVQVRLLDEESGKPLDSFPANRVTGWIKNYLGTFQRGVVEPFAGTVIAIAKTDCDRMILPSGPLDPEVPEIRSILIENTLDTEALNGGPK